MNVFKQDSRSQKHLEEAFREQAIKREHRPNRRRSRTESWTLTASDKAKRNRKLVNSHLHRMSDIVGEDASLNKHGLSIFHFHRFVVTLDVPDDHSDCFRVHTMVFRMDKTDNCYALMKRCMELNYNGEGTRGACLGLDGDEINLFYSSPIAGLTREHLAHCLRDFMQTAIDVSQELDALKH